MKLGTISQINNCIRQIRDGDNEAIQQLHQLVGNHLHFIALRYLKNTQDAQDLVQDFWMRIKSICKGYNYIGNGFNYLAKVLSNMAITQLRQRSRTPMPITNKDIDEYESLSSAVEPTLRQASLQLTIQRAETLMNEEERLVFALFCYQAMTIREIANELNMSKSKVGRLRESAFIIVKQALVEDGWDKNDN